MKKKKKNSIWNIFLEGNMFVCVCVRGGGVGVLGLLFGKMDVLLY